MDGTESKNGIKANMSIIMKQYESMRGRKRADHCQQFWDVVVITAGDDAQKEAFEAQLDSKFSRKELPLDCPIHVVADPPGPKLGNGGSTFSSMDFLEKEYKEDLCEKHVMLIHAGGQSRRMPSTSVLGKIFAPIPSGNPLYQMLDVKLATYLPLIPRMPPGVLICCADDFLVYNLGKEGSDESWGFVESGFTALAHPSTLTIGTKHGVYVVKSLDEVDTSLHIQQSDCLEVLQKPSLQMMDSRGAVLSSKHLQFPDGIEIKGSAAYTDSAYFFTMDVAAKFLKFLKTNGSITCEIDAYGDFLQALGPKATIDYTNHTSNVTNPTPSLIPTRKKVYHMLKDSNIQLLLMNSSKFIHIGTTKEYISHFCFHSQFQEEMSLRKDVFNKWTEEEDDDEDEEPVAKKKAKLSDVSTGCVMHCMLPLKSFVPQNSIVEYCRFEVPVHVGQNVIVSNCSFRKSTADERSNGNKSTHVKLPLKIPHNIFLHTVSVRQCDKTQYVTVLFSIDDDLKKTVPGSKAKQLPLLGATIEDFCKSCGIDIERTLTSCLDKKGQGAETEPVSLWTLRLHPVVDSMTESLSLALQIHTAVTKREKVVSLKGRKLVSMDDILQDKDVKDMLKYRNGLYQEIKPSVTA
ncbi:fucose-1-phosphate guanylyltransferase-like [Mizuhopecten yessoensis]|uniref:Fucose-1-phosphate guanylyltransferase n=1 Tax=Mizuhopecten yessoensis TaxID=6573 RepID=A0A210Q4Y9_MIZYE|nr:fucose-1-phosphate guanylyltransferase-like [Mizuhopecten yessoensis]OWF43785.1 Fucose-1-phosphate guanylyltransferase [Mizuhopecten yessoensis]